MISISDNQIELSKGNDAIININLVIDGEEFSPSEGERLIFTLKKTTKSEVILEKEVVNNQIVLSTSETNLQAGTYLYDLCLISSDSKNTLITPTKFIIKEVVNNEQPGSESA